MGFSGEWEGSGSAIELGIVKLKKTDFFEGMELQTAFFRTRREHDAISAVWLVALDSGLFLHTTRFSFFALESSTDVWNCPRKLGGSLRRSTDIGILKVSMKGHRNLTIVIKLGTHGLWQHREAITDLLPL